MGEAKLTKAQAEVLGFLSRQNIARDGAHSGPEIARSCGHVGYWATDKLAALKKKGFAEPLGSTYSGASTWIITNAAGCGEWT